MLSILLAVEQYTVLKAIMIALIVAIIICAVLVSIAVMIQPSNSNGISAINGSSDTFYEKNKSKTLESKMKKLTVILLIVMAVLMIAYFLIDALWTF